MEYERREGMRKALYFWMKRLNFIAMALIVVSSNAHFGYSIKYFEDYDVTKLVNDSSEIKNSRSQKWSRKRRNRKRKIRSRLIFHNEILINSLNVSLNSQ